MEVRIGTCSASNLHPAIQKVCLRFAHTILTVRIMKFLWSIALVLMLASQSSAQLIINEILYDPSNTALEGDANGDGTYDSVQDEFIEFVNTSAAPLNVSKYKIYDHVLATGVKTLRHTFKNNLILPAGGALVVFGGGSAVGSFGGAYVAVDAGTAGLSLTNSGESVILEDSIGTFIDSISTDPFSDNPNESYTRNPDLTGAFVQHHFATASVLFSPGTRVDGTLFTPFTSIKSKAETADIQIYPNPGKGIFHLTNHKLDGETVHVFDFSGKEVRSVSIQNKAMNLCMLSPGLYLLKNSGGKALSTFVVTP